MDDFRLKVFITAARTLSFTRTAEQLFISQPAVSKHVGELESRYKTQLFVRRGSCLELTPAGETLLTCAERLSFASLFSITLAFMSPLFRTADLVPRLSAGSRALSAENERDELAAHAAAVRTF